MKGCADKGRMSHRRGMTMAEVLAGLAITAFLMLAAMKIMTASTGMFHKIADSARERRITEGLGDTIREQLIYVRALEIDGSGGAIVEDEGQIIFTEDGRILWNGSELYGEEFYTKYRVFCSVHLPGEKDPPDVLDLTLFLENNRKEALYSFRTVVKLVNLELHDKEGITADGEMTEDGNLDSHDQEVCFRFQSPGEEYLQEE